MPVFIFNREVQPPKIAAVLVSGVFLGFINNAQLDPMGVRRRNPCQIEKAKPNALEHALFTALAIVALLNASAQVYLAPREVVGPAEVVTSVEQMLARQSKLPHVFTHSVAPHATAGAKGYMVK